jgi:lipopolysaccharide export system protein LptC
MSAPEADAGSVAPAPAVRPKMAWSWRLREAISAWLPILLMGALALGTWWLVKVTPGPVTERRSIPPRHEPDYAMNDFSVQRFARDGKLRLHIEGAQLRHYPDTDTIEIDEVRIRAVGADDRVTVANARLAVANSAATEVQLQGGAQVLRLATPREPALEMRGEFLEAFLDTERVRSHLPVVVRSGADELRADSFEYDHASRSAQLKGRISATFAPPARRSPNTTGRR